MHSRLLVSDLRRSLPPLPTSPAPPCLPCVMEWQRAAPHSSFPPTTAPLQTLHMDVWGPAHVSGQCRERYFLLAVDDYTRYTMVFPLRSKGGEFSSDLLRYFCRGEGITQSFTLPASPQENGIAERRIGLVMEVVSISMIHVAAPHFLWPFVVGYAAHQLNLWPRVSLPETSPTLRWTGKVGDAPVFRVWGSRAFVHDMSADKLSPCAIPCVFLGFPFDAPGWQFYHPTSHRVLPSQDVTFDESVPFYRLFPYRSAPPPPPPLFLTPGPPPVDPLPPQGLAPSGVSQVEPLPGTALVEVAGDSGAARGAAFGGLGPGGAEPGGAESEVAGSGGAGPGGVEPRGVEPGGAEPKGRAVALPEPLSTHQLREWLVWHARLQSGATGAGGTGGTAAAGPGGPRTRGARAAGTGRAGGAGAGAPTEPGATGAGAGGARAGGAKAGGTGAGGAGARGIGARGAGVGGVGAVDPGAGASPLPAPSPYTEQSGGLTERCGPVSRLVSPIRVAHCVPRPRPPPVPGTHAMALRPSSIPLRVPLLSPPESSLPAVLDPESDLVRAASPTVSRLLATVVTDPTIESVAASALVSELVDFATACRIDYATALVAESESVGPSSVGGECALGTDVLEDRQEDFECLAAAVPRFASMLLAPEGDPDALDIPTPRSYAEAITVLLHVAAQRDYELHSLDFSTAFLQGSLHEEIWLRRPPGFTESFPTSTQWSLRRPIYGLCQGPREWHDTLRTTFADLGFAPSTDDPSLFLRTDTSLPPFYVLVYVDDLVFATADTEALTLVKSELQKRHTCTNLGELRSYLGLQITRDRARRTITLTQSHMVHRVLQRFGFQFSLPQPTPLSTSHSLSAPPSDESVEPSGPTTGMGLVLGGWGPVVLTGHADASWVDDSATQHSSQGYTFSLGFSSVSWRSTRSSSVLSSNCEAEIYAGAMAAQELRWLTYLLTDLGEQPRSPLVLYVDNKAMIALCQEHSLEHRMKHIAPRYFLARELQQRGQLRLAYMATRANIADIFTKALSPGDHQRFSTVLGLLALLCLTGLAPRPLCLSAPATAAAATAATAAPACCTTMASLRVLAFDHEGRPVQFDTWLDDLQLYLLSDSKDSVSLFDLASGAATTPPATSDTQALYDPVVARYSSPATAALGRLLVPYLFPELSPFATVADLVTHLRTSLARYRAAVLAEFLPTNQPPMFITLYFIVTRLPASLRSVRDHSHVVSFMTAPLSLLSLHLSLSDWSSPPLVLYELGEYRCPPGCDGHYHHSWGVDIVHTGYRASSCSCVCSGVRVRLGSRLLLVSPPVAPDSSVAPPPRSPLPATPSWHALPSSRLWSTQVSPSLPHLPAPPCLPCVEGRQRAAPHSSSFPPTTAPLHTLHMDVWGPARVSGQGYERYFLLVVDDYTWYTTVFPLRNKDEVVDVLIPWIRIVRLQLRERFRQDLPVLRLHSDRGGEFSSNLLRKFCRGEGILHSFTLLDSPQQNGIAERRIGLVMEIPRPHCVGRGEVGDASVFRVWGSRAFVRDTSADKLSARAIPCVFLGFVPDAPGWQFYHPTLRRVLPSQDVTFDESVPFYRLFPYRSAPPPPPPLFLAPGPPPVDPLQPQGPTPSDVSQVDPVPGTAPIKVAIGLGAAPRAASRGAAFGGEELGGAGSEGAGSGVAGSGGAEPGGEEPGVAEPEGVEPGGAESEGADSGGADPQGAASSGSPAGASLRLSPQQLREWLVRRARLRSGAPGVGGAGDTAAGGARVTSGAGGNGGTVATNPGGARTRGAGAAGTGGVGGAGAGDPTKPGAARAGGSCAGGAGTGGAGSGGAGVGGTSAGGARAVGARAVDLGNGGAGGTVRQRPYFVPLLQQVLGFPSSTGLTPSFLCQLCHYSCC
ncbi:unnamed protein product [Closterium sp. NIES-53]